MIVRILRHIGSIRHNIANQILQTDSGTTDKINAKRLFCGFDSLDLSQGGIARVGRLIYRTLADPPTGLSIETDAAVYRDQTHHGIGSGRVSCAGLSKWRYLLAVNRAGLDHSHFFYDFLGMARAHGGLPRLMHRPYTCFVHGIEAWPGPWARPDRLRAAQRATMLIANSQFTIARASEWDPTFARAKCCWLATETDDAPDLLPINNGPPRVLILGRLEEGLKGHQELMACWPKVLSAVPDAVLTIVGRGPRLDEFRKLAADSGADAQIEFRGFVSEDELPQLWQRTTAFAMPGRGEGFGLTYIEAMRYGIPVLASVHDAGSEINVDGVTGYNVNLNRADELPDRLIQLLRNRDQSAALGENGRQRWSDHFRFSAFRKRIVPVLREFLGC